MQWLDAHGSTDFVDPDDIDADHKPRIATSLGFLVKRNEVGLTIAGCLDSEGMLDRVLFIPTEMVVSVKVLGGRKSR